ncbi:MAG: tRNA (adenosine(37)-N6)-dimethylallyltransferase MiaA [Sphaerochaetaceae bacterium]|nr:tRNA (adenosine(37)-N6)-dimethylallyltransferase MiaA [Sphaerochaetaceae bacterium]
MSIQNQSNRKSVFLFGPTAVGKTGLLCSFFSSDFEVVNADSVQVYRRLDIGSAKASEKERKAIRHHLIDILEPWEKYSVADFIRLGDEACSDIYSRGKYPVLSGGTAFYFKHFIYGLSEAPQSDEKTREEVKLMIQELGKEESHKYLESIDPVSSSRINVNDTYRVSRAIEVYKASGRPLSSFALPTEPRNSMDALIIGLKRERDELAKRIRERVDIMFSEGLMDEISSLMEEGANPQWQSMQAIGYKEFLSVLFADGKRPVSSLSSSEITDIKESICMNSIHYAKRQMTFFNSFKNVHWMNPEDEKAISELVRSWL